jgi:hypothetical protein
MGETQTRTRDVPEDCGLGELRNTALHVAIRIAGGKSDYREVILAARDIFAFLKEG